MERHSYSAHERQVHMSSEVQRLRQEIELRCQAVRLCLDGYAEVSKHQTIEHKYNALGKSWRELEQFVGSENAKEIVASTYASVMARDTIIDH